MNRCSLDTWFCLNVSLPQCPLGGFNINLACGSYTRTLADQCRTKQTTCIQMDHVTRGQAYPSRLVKMGVTIEPWLTSPEPEREPVSIWIKNAVYFCQFYQFCSGGKLLFIFMTNISCCHVIKVYKLAIKTLIMALSFNINLIKLPFLYTRYFVSF